MPAQIFCRTYSSYCSTLLVLGLLLLCLTSVSCTSQRQRTTSEPAKTAGRDLPGTQRQQEIRQETTQPREGPASTANNRTAAPGLAPIADRPITVVGSCSQTEEDGFREQAQLKVENNVVSNLSWQLWVGKRGQCKFEGAEFTQTKERPHIELSAKDGSGCRLLIWQTPQRITLAHNGCEKRCTPGIYEDAWPVMFHPKTGACARVG